MRVIWTLVVIIVTASLVQVMLAWSTPAFKNHIEKTKRLEAELKEKSAALDECILTRQGIIDAIVEQE